MSAATGTARRIFEPEVLRLRVLDEEHAEIERRYVVLEAEILSGRGMPSMVKAAENLVEAMLQHFAQEEQFLETISRLVLLRHLKANAKTTVQLLDIEDGLRQEKPSAVLQLLLLVKVWLYWHTWTESIDFECGAPVPARRHGILARRELPLSRSARR
jgi:hemerythrin